MKQFILKSVSVLIVFIAHFSATTPSQIGIYQLEVPKSLQK